MRGKSGFTLIEIVIVMVIMGITVVSVAGFVSQGALLMAEYSLPETRITTIEKYEKRIPVARANFDKYDKNLAQKVIEAPEDKIKSKVFAMLSMVGGTVLYCLAQGMGFKIMGLHQITIGITVSLILFLIGSYVGKPEDKETLGDFFPE